MVKALKNTIFALIVFVGCASLNRLENKFEFCEENTEASFVVRPWKPMTKPISKSYIDSLGISRSQKFNIESQDRIDSIIEFLKVVEFDSEKTPFNLRFHLEMKCADDSLNVYVGKNNILQMGNKSCECGLEFMSLVMRDFPDSLKSKYLERDYRYYLRN